MRSLICAAMMLLTVVAVQARTVNVDCDAGDDLGAVLNRLAATRPSGLAIGENSDAGDVAVTINISGTCIGNFVITTTGLILQGAGPGPEAAVLQGKASIQSVTPVLDIRGAYSTALRDLTFTGGSRGLRVRNSDALVIDCEFRGNGVGLLSEGSQTFVNGSLFTDNQSGVQSSFGDFTSLNDTLVVDNAETGVEAFSGSRLLIDGGEISGNLFGIKLIRSSSAFLRQPLVIGETTGGSHIQATGHSTVTLNDGVTVSGSDDIEIGENSLLEAREASIDVDLVLFRFGHASLRGTPVAGDMSLLGFSNAILTDDASVSGTLSCDDTSDADCAGGAVGDASGCDHCGVEAADPVGTPRGRR